MYGWKQKKNGEKLRRMEERHNEKDRLTNWYMINLTWGAVAMGRVDLSAKLLQDRVDSSSYATRHLDNDRGIRGCGYSCIYAR